MIYKPSIGAGWKEAVLSGIAAFAFLILLIALGLYIINAPFILQVISNSLYCIDGGMAIISPGMIGVDCS